MTLLLTHIGPLPPYIEYSLKQFRTFNPHVKTVFIGDTPNEGLMNKYNIEYYYCNLHNSPKFKTARDYDSTHNIFHHWPSKDFWFYTYARFYAIEEYLQTTPNLKDFFFFENDILLYKDLGSIKKFLNKQEGDIFFTMGDDTRITTGFSYFRHKNSFFKLVKDMDDILFNPAEIQDIRRNYSECCPSEMTILRKIKNKFNYITPLPILPVENSNFIFDPASYGQFLGGDQEGNANFIDETTYICQEILNQNIKITFETEKDRRFSSYGYRKPFCEYKGKKYRICNLHLWSKKLENFQSKPCD